MLTRRQIYFSTNQTEKIQKIADDKGIGFSEQVRRIIDEWLDIKNIKDGGKEE